MEMRQTPPLLNRLYTSELHDPIELTGFEIDVQREGVEDEDIFILQQIFDSYDEKPTVNQFEKNIPDLFEEFKKATYDAIERGISLNPILHSFQMTVNQYKIDHALIDAFLYSMELDLGKHTYDRAGYETYIYGSAEVVGLMCLYIFCEGNQAQYDALKPAAKSLGSAFQKVNINFLKCRS